ncbi:hypothetical protein F8M41_022758 [Gigaspora margarita]|uniref:HMG box domain-containing protein n=1 Tax=Gigaspora margarita TaxID=4874 RepID=A0A8H4EHU2_GIGMA|nr:hypothetical protein F8M41_022758 [Gigaspora margarita]
MVFEFEGQSKIFFPFLLFSIEVHDTIISQFPNLNSQEISNIILKLWEYLSENFQSEYKKKLIQNKIIETAEFLVMTLDIWTYSSYFGITCHWLIHDFKLIGVVLYVTKFTGTLELFEKLQSQLSKSKLTNENIISITTNNIDYVVKESLSQMQIEIIPCFENILQISVESIIENKKLKEKIIFSNDELDICRELYIILNLFHELTEMLKGSKYSALSFVTPAIKNLKQCLNIYQPKNDVIRQIINNILDILTNNFVVPSTLGLYGSFFDPRFKKILYIDRLREQLTELVKPVALNNLENDSDSKMLTFFQENVQTKFDNYLELPQLPVTEENNPLA